MCIAYIPPPDSTYSKSLKQEILDQIESDIYSFKLQGNIVLMGDLNARVGETPDFIDSDCDKHLPVNNYILDNSIPQRNSQDKTVDERGKHLIEICITAQLRILNGRKIGDSMGYLTSHQYNGSSVVDYAICSEALLTDIAYFKIHDLIGTLTDHCMISFFLKAKLDHQIKEQPIKLTDQPKQFKWKEGSTQIFQQALRLPHITSLINDTLAKLDTQTGTAHTSVNQITNIFMETAKMALKHKTLKKEKRPLQPWSTSQLRRLEREVNRKGTEMAKYQTGEHRKNFFLALKLYRKQRKYAKRHYINTKIRELNDIQNNPREFWQLLDKLKQTNTKDNPADKIEPGKWYRYLSQLNRNPEGNNNETVHAEIEKLLINKNFSPLDFQIKTNEINDALKKLKNDKSPGLDMVSNEMLKAASKALMPCLHKLFNRIFTTGEYPEQWCTGIVTNIHKKGSFLDPQNYRSITITSSIGKLFNSIMNTRLESFLEEHNIISPYQIGFQKGSSTADHIFSLKTIINKYTNKDGEKLYACFVDFKQAFDRVWHQGLFLKLAQIGINNNFFHYIRTMYSQTRLHAKIGNQITQDIKSDIGVRQGDNLSPTLFKIYINDLQNYITRANDTHPVCLGSHTLNCLLYADDIVLLSTSKTGLQNCINALYNFSKDWRLEVNLNKTKTLIFNKRGHFLKEKLIYGKELIECTDSYTYLGIKFQNSGTFQEAVSNLCEKALKAMFKIDTIIKESYGLRTVLHIFDHAIRPILMYGSEVWGGDLIRSTSHLTKPSVLENYLEKNSLSAIELKFYRRLLGVKRNTSTIGIRGELGRYPLSILAIKQFVKYINMINTRKNDSLVKAALSEDTKRYQAGKRNSMYHTYVNLLESIKEKPISNNETKTKIKKFSGKVERKLQERYRQHWFENISATASRTNRGGNKLRTYYLLKQNFTMEPYLELVDNTSHRKAATQLRLSSHPLNIEHMRGKIQDPKNRICQMCNTQETENEIHFVVSCIKYKEQREDLLQKINSYTDISHLADKETFIWLLSNEDRLICKLVAKFIKDCFDIRKASISC